MTHIYCLRRESFFYRGWGGGGHFSSPGTFFFFRNSAIILQLGEGGGHYSTSGNDPRSYSAGGIILLYTGTESVWEQLTGYKSELSVLIYENYILQLFLVFTGLVGSGRIKTLGLNVTALT